MLTTLYVHTDYYILHVCIKYVLIIFIYLKRKEIETERHRERACPFIDWVRTGPG